MDTCAFFPATEIINFVADITGNSPSNSASAFVPSSLADAHLYFIGFDRIKISNCKVNAIMTFIIYTACIFSFDLKTYFHNPQKIGELPAHRRQAAYMRISPPMFPFW